MCGELSTFFGRSILVQVATKLLAPRRTTTSPTCQKKKRLGKRAWAGASANAVCVDRSWTPQLEHGETCSTAEATRGHYACVHAVFGGLKLADPGITMEPRGLTEAPSRPADLLTDAAVPGRSAAPDVRAPPSPSPPNAAVARGDAAQAAFDRKLSYYRHRAFVASRGFSVDAIRCHRCLPASRAQQVFDCQHGGR